MPTDDPLVPPFPALDDALGAPSWLGAMLDVERALATASEAAGVVPAGTSAAVGDAVDRVAAQVEADDLSTAGARAGTVVIPLVAALRADAGPLAEYVHFGATSQDVIDTALALVVRRAWAVVQPVFDATTAALAVLADRHRHAVCAGRTLLQRGDPTTFGLKAARWRAGLLDGPDNVAAAVAAFPLQLGGPVGTLAAFGDAAPAVVDRFAAELDLPVPILPWHAERAPVARLAAALGRLAGATGKAARDLVLLAQPEVAEVAERDEPGRGVSSAMPGKRNPVAGVAAIAAARRARPLAAELATALDHEHERAAGAWQAEAPMLCDLWRHTGRAVAALADALDGLVVDEARMAANAGEGAPDFGQIDRLITGALTRTGTSVAR